MAKNDLKQYTCQHCGISFTSTGYRAYYCDKCKTIKRAETAHNAYIKRKNAETVEKARKRRASVNASVKKYDSKRDVVTIRLPKGTIARIKELNSSPTNYIKDLVLQSLDK